MILDLPAAYEILGLPQGTDWKLVQARYRELVKAFHPDRFSGLEKKAYAEAKLKQIIIAKEIIEKYWRSVEAKPLTAAATANAKTPPPAPGSGWQAFKAAWSMEIEPALKKWDKKVNVDDALNDYGKPIRLTRDTKRRRFYVAIALILLIDLFFAWQAQQAKKQPSKILTLQVHGLPATDLAVGKSDFDRRQSEANKLEHQCYFLKLQLDRCNLAMRQDVFIAHQIELKLAGSSLAGAEQRRLQEMKIFHEKDWAMQELQKSAIMTQLLQLSAS